MALTITTFYGDTQRVRQEPLDQDEKMRLLFLTEDTEADFTYLVLAARTHELASMLISIFIPTSMSKHYREGVDEVKFFWTVVDLVTSPIRLLTLPIAFLFDLLSNYQFNDFETHMAEKYHIEPWSTDRIRLQWDHDIQVTRPVPVVYDYNYTTHTNF